MPHTRRTFLTTAVGVAGLGALAGCTGSSADDTDNVAQATFFVFGDITSAVTGDAAASNLLVPVGQHGHGWEPGPRVREDINNTDLLVHGMEGFQPWVDDIRRDLDADGAGVATVDVSTGVDLLEAGDHGDEHEDGTHEVHEEGTHDDHEEKTHDEEGDHDHGTMDPHFWMDPLRVRDAVDTVRQGLADVDSDNAGAYTENAEAYRGRLEDLHSTVESTVDDASTEVLLVAGHDSFQYLGDRYDIEVHALTDVSPDDQPTARDIERAQEIIQTHDLAHICADPLESQQAAEQLVAETDAQAVLPLTAMPGLTDEWSANDWGYVEVMENVNLPTIADALGS